MGSRAIRAAGGNTSINGRASHHSYSLERCRYHLLRNVIPTILIVVGTTWVTLLLAEQIYKAKQTRPERSSVATPKRQQGTAKHIQKATEDKPQSL